MTTLKHRLQQLLPDSHELSEQVCHTLFDRCDPRTQELLCQSTVTFFRIPATGGLWQTVILIAFEHQSISTPREWDMVQEIAERLVAITGVTEIHIRDRHLRYQCQLDADNKWVANISQEP